MKTKVTFFLRLTQHDVWSEIGWQTYLFFRRSLRTLQKTNDLKGYERFQIAAARSRPSVPVPLKAQQIDAAVDWLEGIAGEE